MQENGEAINQMNGLHGLNGKYRVGLYATAKRAQWFMAFLENISTFSMLNKQTNYSEVNMSKHDLRDYAGLLILISVMLFGMYHFTKFVDRHADKQYERVYGQANKR